ncbi:MAG: LVIVD repeat-containing protein [Thermoplasmatota archaeon]
MRSSSRLLPLALAFLLVGCLQSDGEQGEEQRTPDGGIDHAAVAAAIGEPIVMDHDHTDASLHTGSHNLDLVAWSSLGVQLGQNGFANFVLHEDGESTLAFVAVDGDERGGFTIVDISSVGGPEDVHVLGSYRIDGNNIQEVRVTPDGRFAVLNVQAIPEQGFFTTPNGPADCGVCIQVINVEDRAAPQLVSVLPVELLGTHNMEFHVLPDGQLYLFYVGQPLAGTNPDPAGNRIGIARFQELSGGNAILVPVGNLVHDTAGDDGRSFPHDVTLAEHPLTGQTLAYVSWWQGGAITFDVSTAATQAMGEIGRNADPAPSSALAIHWLTQEPALRKDGRLIAWSAPEIGSLDDGTGVIRAYDVSDPTQLVQLGTWQLPGNLTIEGRYLLSPHTAVPDQSTGLLAVAHYHAGVWILDMTDPAQPEAVAYYLPHGAEQDPFPGPIWWKKPNFNPDGFLPNAYMARWHDGLLWVTERGTGLYALRYTGPIPGPVA